MSHYDENYRNNSMDRRKVALFIEKAIAHLNEDKFVMAVRELRQGITNTETGAKISLGIATGIADYLRQSVTSVQLETIHSDELVTVTNVKSVSVVGQVVTIRFNNETTEIFNGYKITGIL